MFRSPFQSPFQNPIPTMYAPAEDWWLSGGISAGDVASVWQPKGAASLAASYLRLAGSEGNANIDPSVVGGDAPTWDAVSGWKYNGTSQYLKPGVIPSSNWSMIVRFSNVTNQSFLLGSQGTLGSQFYIRPNLSGSSILWGNGGIVVSSPELLIGVLAIATTHGYRNGVQDVSGLGLWSGIGSEILFGAFNNNGASVSVFSASYIQAVSIYKVAITAPQVLAVTNAMNAL